MLVLPIEQHPRVGCALSHLLNFIEPGPRVVGFDGLDTQPDPLILGQPDGVERLEPGLITAALKPEAQAKEQPAISFACDSGFNAHRLRFVRSVTTTYRTCAMSTKASGRPHSQTIDSGVESAAGAIPDNPRWFVVIDAFERDDLDVVTR